RLLLTIEKRPDSSDSAALGGSLIFGEGTPPPPATDGRLGYPEGFDYVSYLSYTEPTDVIANYDDGLPPLEGFDYEIEPSSSENAASLMLRTSGDSLIGVFDDATFLNARGLATPIGEVRFRRIGD